MLPTVLLAAHRNRLRQGEFAYKLRPSRQNFEEIFAMRKLLLICLALCVMFMLVGITFAADSTTVNGIVSDSKCGAKNAGAFDLCAACSGFVYGVTVAALVLAACGAQPA